VAVSTCAARPLLFIKIALLALPGVLVTGWAFAETLLGVGRATGPTMAMRSRRTRRILASTDPAAIIPLLQGSNSSAGRPKDIVVASALMMWSARCSLPLLKLPLAAMTIAAAYAAAAAPETVAFWRTVGASSGCGL
jgi:hypothetical protein